MLSDRQTSFSTPYGVSAVTAVMPALAFDCGVDDYLIEHSRRFAATLGKLGLPHEYREHPGAHTWDYWERHLPDAIAHHVRVLGLR